MEDIQGGVHGVGDVPRSPLVGVAGFLFGLLQLPGAPQPVVNGFGRRDQLFEESGVFFLGFGTGFIGQVFFQLLDVGAHLFRIGDAFVHPAAVKFDDVF